jgi:hypothetical protein
MLGGTTWHSLCRDGRIRHTLLMVASSTVACRAVPPRDSKDAALIDTQRIAADELTLSGLSRTRADTARVGS